jgi:CubicO group peptidase (beta-lactamase class C family)
MPLPPHIASRIDAIVARAQATGRAPSLVMGVVRAGELDYFTGAGTVPAPSPDVQYRIGSITKTFTAVLLAQLRDAGAVDLDDRLEEYLPGTPVGRVTLRQLLAHVSGLQREPEGTWWERSAGTDLAGLLADLTPAKLFRPAFRGYHYSNLAYGLLGGVIEKVGGATWTALLTDRVLGPLGLGRTSALPVEPYAKGYVVHPWHGTLREEPRHDAGAMAPAGQLWSTVEDLARWAAFVADPAASPDPSVLAPDTLAELLAPAVVTDLRAWTAAHALGFELWRRGDRVVVGHTGSMPGYVAVLQVHRESGAAVVGFANCYGLRSTAVAALGLDVLDAVLDGEPPAERVPWRPAPAAPPAEIAPLTGVWWWMGQEFHVRYDGSGELVVTQVAGTDQLEREPWRFTLESPDRWRCHTGTNTGEFLHVRRDAHHHPIALDIATFVFERQP